MKITQLSVFLENKPGRLEHILQVLADHAINIETLTIAEVKDFGILRLIVDRPVTAFTALRSAQITCNRTEVLAVAVDIRPGSLLKLLDAFSRRQINIEYMYAFSGRKETQPIMIFRFEDVVVALKALEEEGYTLVPRAEVQAE
jgi:hypothetical protein